MPTIRFTEEAGNELKQAALWYEEQRRGLGSAFMLSIEGTLAKIRRNPEMFAVVDEETRRAPTKRFPYGVYFKLEGGITLILGVVHKSRKPGIWKGRR